MPQTYRITIRDSNEVRVLHIFSICCRKFSIYVYQAVSRLFVNFDFIHFYHRFSNTLEILMSLPPNELVLSVKAGYIEKS